MTDSSPFGFSGSDDHATWLAEVEEEIVEPDLPLVDAHHHLWVRGDEPYLLREYVEDLNTGHNVVATVFAECHSMYRQHGPAALRPVGESEFVAGMAAMSDSGVFGPTKICRAMIGSIDVRLGADVEPVVEAHETASGGRFRGVRVSAAYHEGVYSPCDDPNLLADDEVRKAIGVLQDRGHVLDVWVYHSQLEELAELAAAFDDLPIIANHTGVPVLGGPYRGRLDAAFQEWHEGMAVLAARPNVVMKLGGLPLRAKDSSTEGAPATSDDIVRAWERWIDASVELFGPDRCFFETNFPVHKKWCSYPVLWNAFKKLSANYSPDERTALLSATAARVYSVDLDD